MFSLHCRIKQYWRFSQCLLSGIFGLHYHWLFRLAFTTVEAPGAQPLPQTQNEIVIQNFAFEPATLTVKAGTKVTWVNRDDEPHTATATDKRFNSKTLENGDRFSTEFNTAGHLQVLLRASSEDDWSSHR